MAGNNAVALPDRRARITFLFHQELRKVRDAEPLEPVAADPCEIYRDRIWELQINAEACPHYLQPTFLTDLARTHTKALLERADEVRQRFRDFHHDRQFVSHLKERHPTLYLWARWEVYAVAIAEKFDAATLPNGTLLPSPAKKKPTPEEVRAFKVRRQQVQTDDMIALARAKLEATLKARQFLDEYDLDEDERKQYEKELTGDIMSAEEEPTTNRTQPTTGFKQL